MPQDHFVAQTYLKHFGDNTRRRMLNAYRKRDGKYFPCWPRDVCREWEGDQNRLLAHPELLGDFRKMVEPYWNPSVENMLRGTLTSHDKFVIATYMANLMTCTPAWRRVGVSHHNQQYLLQLALLQEIKKRRGEQDAMFTEGMKMLDRGELTVDTDPDYIKGLMTKSLMQYAWYIYNQDWTVLSNKSSSTFLTSDNPVALDYSEVAGASIHRYLPITPRLCLAVNFDPVSDPPAERLSTQELEAGLMRAPRGSITHAACSDDRVRHINRVQVRSAEDLVFSSTASEGIGKLVKKHARYRMDVEVVQYPDYNEGSVIRGSILSVRQVRD